MTLGALTVFGVLTSTLSFLGGLWAATYLQDREIRRRHLGIVRALLSEIVRVGGEVGAEHPKYVNYSFHGARPAVPVLAPWVYTLSTDLASTNASCLSDFMTLDRVLRNLAVSDADCDSRNKRLGALREALEAHRKSSDAGGYRATEAEITTVDRAVTLQTDVVNVDFRLVRESLDRLRASLRADESDLAGGWRTHLPWKRRSIHA